LDSPSSALGSGPQFPLFLFPEAYEHCAVFHGLSDFDVEVDVVGGEHNLQLAGDREFPGGKIAEHGFREVSEEVGQVEPERGAAGVVVVCSIQLHLDGRGFLLYVGDIEEEGAVDEKVLPSCLEERETLNPAIVGFEGAAGVGVEDEDGSLGEQLLEFVFGQQLQLIGEIAAVGVDFVRQFYGLHIASG
jgi:hypothetical protein